MTTEIAEKLRALAATIMRRRSVGDLLEVADEVDVAYDNLCTAGTEENLRVLVAEWARATRAYNIATAPGEPMAA